MRPEAVGIDINGILSFVSEASNSRLYLNSMMLLRHGKIVTELYWSPFSADKKHNIYSCTKSFTSTAVGLAIGEGLFSLDDKIVDLLPKKLKGNPHPYIAALRVRHLLTMCTSYSIFQDPVTDDWTAEFLNSKPDHYPGTIFCYDTSGTHTLGEIVETLSGCSLEEYLKPRLFEPLGIDDYEWEIGPMGIRRGGGGLRINTQAMARFGLLYANGGVFNNRRILPREWVELSTACHVDASNDFWAGDNLGYGFQFWRLRNNSFACMGLGGQSILILPDKDVVFVVTANTMRESGGAEVLELFWGHIYPKIAKDALPPNEKLGAELERRSASLQCGLPEGSAWNDKLGNLFGRKYALQPNPIGYQSFQLDVGDSRGRLTLYKDRREDIVEFGLGTYIDSAAPFQQYASPVQTWGKYTFIDDPEPRRRCRCGSAAVWVDEQTLVVLCHLTQTVQSFMVKCHFGSEAIVIQITPVGVYDYPFLPCALTHMKKGSLA